MLAGRLVRAAGDVPFRLQTNQSSNEQLNANGSLDIADSKAVFWPRAQQLARPCEGLSHRELLLLHVPSSERALHGQHPAGERARDQGKVHFLYSIESNLWSERYSAEVFHILLDGDQGVTVETLAALSYRVAFQGKSVIFDLDDLSAVRPPVGMLTADERYTGRFSTSQASVFSLFYNPKLKLFHYLLDETIEVADVFLSAIMNERLIIGRRTAFAFYRDAKRERKILVGVFDGNVRVNNYFDGPFDQLLDNLARSVRLSLASRARSPASAAHRAGSAVSDRTVFAISGRRGSLRDPHVRNE